MGRFADLERIIKNRVPSFEIRFKDESLFMRLLGKLIFFNSRFMTDYVTIIGTKVYFPSRKRFEDNPEVYFSTLAHEGVHLLDFVRHPVRFVLGFLFPQILASLAFLSLLACFYGPMFLLFLLALLLVAPIPAPFRTNSEIRGYGMNLRLVVWQGFKVTPELLERYADAFTTSAYYYMCPFRKQVLEKLLLWADPVDWSDFLDKDPNPMFSDVYNLLKLE